MSRDRVPDTARQPPSESPSNMESGSPDRRLLFALAFTCGAVVANLYYNQPLLADIAHGFHASTDKVGLVPTLTQLGYALGIFLIVPLGDKIERRRLIIGLLWTVATTLMLTGCARSLEWLAIASFAVGVTSVAPQVIVPFAAGLASPAERGRVVGFVMSGLLIGILAARTVSGFIGDALGWRSIFILAAVLMIALALTLRKLLPQTPPANGSASYFQLIGSLLTIFRQQPLLRRAAFMNAMSFGAFSAFWSTLTFLLAAPPFHFTPNTIGLFGLGGVAGAVGAPLSGRLADKSSPVTSVRLGLSVLLLSFALLWFGQNSIALLIAGILFMDFGAQMTVIGNQTLIYSLSSELHSRLNALFIGIFFIGGALGSLTGTIAWEHARWTGACLVAATFALCGLAASLIVLRNAHFKREKA